MENSVNKLIDVASDKASQMGFYWFLNKLLDHSVAIIFILMLFYVFVKVIGWQIEMDRRKMLLEERRHNDEIARRILSDIEYRDRFKNWPKLNIEEQDKL